MDSHDTNICVISLDALNLNFLESRYQQNLIQPLSMAKNNIEFCTDSYCEFEVHKNEEFDENKEKSSNQELLYITCHICKIQVPQNFYHQHKYSFKHEINTKIANIAVQRLQKHLNCHYDIVNVTTNTSKHFCPVCVTVMDSVEKKSHETSMGHKNSIIVENFLNEFLMLYENAECQTDSSINCNTQNTNSKKEMDVTIKKVANISNIKDSSNENAIQKVYVNEVEETIMPIKDYLILSKEKLKTEFIEFKVVKENDLVIKTVDGSLVRVSTDNFHSFKEIGPRTMRCAICQEVIVTSNKHKHILTNKHMELAWSLPLQNKNCMRHIDETWNHCLLCNLGFEDVDSHILSAEHENNLIVCVLYESNNDKTNEEASTSSSVSGHNDINKTETHILYSEDSSMQDGNEYQKLSEYTEKDKSLYTVDSESSDLNKISACLMNLVKDVHDKQFCIYCNVFISKKGLKKHSVTTKHYMNTLSDFHYFMKDADDIDYYLCRLCDEKIAKPIHEVKKHATLPKHLQNYNALLSRNNIKKIEKNEFFCSLCCVKILIKNEIFHVNSQTHKRHLEAQNTKCAESNATTSYSLVDKMFKTPELQLKTEIKKEGMKDKNNFFCDICNVHVPNTKHNIETHIKGGPHIKNMEKTFDKKIDVEKKETVDGKINIVNVVDKSKVQIDSSTKETNISTDKKCANNYYNLQKTKNAYLLKCLVCDVFITNNETNIGTHVNGLNHSNNYTIIIETNHLDIKDNDIYCNVCSVHISIGNEISHCKGKRHASKLAATTFS